MDNIKVGGPTFTASSFVFCSASKPVLTITKDGELIIADWATPKDAAEAIRRAWGMAGHSRRGAAVTGHINWLPIAEIPDELKDGREVLLWDDDGSADVGVWAKGAYFGQGEPGWSETAEGGPLGGVTHFAEISPPS